MRFLSLLVVLLLVVLLSVSVVDAKKPAHDQVRKGEHHIKKTVKSLGPIAHAGETISQRKITKLNAPKVEYYHEVQKTNDKEVDRTARSIIDNPQRAAYRLQKINDKIFSKTVSSASSILHHHNAEQAAKIKPAKKA